MHAESAAIAPRTSEAIEAMRAAQAEIIRLLNENDRLKEQIAAPWMDGYEAAKDHYRQHIINAEDENERLREALKIITECDGRFAAEVAFRALKGDSE